MGSWKYCRLWARCLLCLMVTLASIIRAPIHLSFQHHPLDVCLWSFPFGTHTHPRRSTSKFTWNLIWGPTFNLFSLPIKFPSHLFFSFLFSVIVFLLSDLLHAITTHGSYSVPDALSVCGAFFTFIVSSEKMDTKYFQVQCNYKYNEWCIGKMQNAIKNYKEELDGKKKYLVERLRELL